MNHSLINKQTKQPIKQPPINGSTQLIY